MTLEEVGNWTGNMADIGPLYPWVGAESIFAIVLLIFWIGWHVLQFRMEERNYNDDMQTLKREGNMDRALKGERILRSM
jgi:hypothetical protein